MRQRDRLEKINAVARSHVSKCARAIRHMRFNFRKNVQVSSNGYRLPIVFFSRTSVTREARQHSCYDLRKFFKNYSLKRVWKTPTEIVLTLSQKVRVFPTFYKPLHVTTVQCYY